MPSPNNPRLVPLSPLLNTFSSTGLKPVTFAGWGLVKMPGRLGRVTITFQGSSICEGGTRRGSVSAGGLEETQIQIFGHMNLFT